MKNAVSLNSPHKEGVGYSINTYFKKIGSYLKDFRFLHNDVQIILLLLSLFILPAYIFTGHFFELLTEIQILLQGGEGDSLTFISRLVETGIILYSLVIWLYYHIGLEEVKKEVKKIFPGAHDCIRKTYVPSHLLFNEVKPDDESKTIFNEGFNNLGKDEDDFLSRNPEVYNFLKNESSYKEAFENAFSEDMKASVDINTQDDSPRYVSLLDKLNELPEEL